MKPLDFYKNKLKGLNHAEATTFLKQDENFLCGLEIKDSFIDIYLIYAGEGNPVYFSFFNGNLLFSGDDYKPAASHCRDTLECVVGLLDWFVLQIGDTATDFFKNYTPFQIKWRESMYAQNLRMYCMCFVNPEDIEHEEAKNYFTNWFIEA